MLSAIHLYDRPIYRRSGINISSTYRSSLTSTAPQPDPPTTLWSKLQPSADVALLAGEVLYVVRPLVFAYLNRQVQLYSGMPPAGVDSSSDTLTVASIVNQNYTAIIVSLVYIYSCKLNEPTHTSYYLGH
jgi:hypothetical protein